MKGENAFITLTSTYDMRLVVLSYLVASVASFTALDLAGRVTSSKGGTRTLWLVGGAIAMGVGIWSMHFIAALAFILPIPVSYDVPMTLISMIPAIIVSWIALFVVSRESMGITPLIVGGLIMGPGIAAMHYTGVSAMRMEGMISYNPALIGLSVFVAFVISLVALWLAFHLRSETGGIGTLQKFVSAMVMGGAIVGMHFTGQAATSVSPLDSAVALHGPEATAGNTWLAVMIGIATGAILGLVLLSSFFNKRASGHSSVGQPHSSSI